MSISFHMKVLFKLAGDNPKVQAACVENLIAALISAYLSFQENMASPSGQHGCIFKFASQPLDDATCNVDILNYLSRLWWP